MSKRLRTPGLLALTLALALSMLPISSFGQGVDTVETLQVGTVPGEADGSSAASDAALDGSAEAATESASADDAAAGADAAASAGADAAAEVASADAAAGADAAASAGADAAAEAASVGADTDSASESDTNGDDAGSGGSASATGTSLASPEDALPLDEQIRFSLSPFSTATINLGEPDPSAGGTGWSYDSTDEVFTIEAGANVTVTGTTITRRVVVAGDATVTLNGATINRSTTAAVPFRVDAGATVNLTLLGESTLQGGLGLDALQIDGTSTLSINGSTGVLAATGGKSPNPDEDESNGAGISGGTLTITGGTVKATSGDDGWLAGIFCETIKISGGTVEATGGAGNDSPGIYDSTLTIEGGTVTATGGAGSDGQSGGSGIESDNLTIAGGAVTAIGGAGGWGTGIYNYDDLTITDGTVTATGGAGEYADGIFCETTITIEDGTVTAIGGAGNWGAGIYSCEALTIKGGTVEATGGAGTESESGGTGIVGDGDLTITDGTVTATGGVGGWGGAGISGYNLTIEGGTVEATGGVGTDDGSGGAGILSSIVSIEGGTVRAAGGTVTGTAEASDWAAGIIGDEITITDGTVTATGGVSSNAVGIFSYDTLTIEGGTVEATGGTGEYADGISCATLTITGGMVTATGGAGANSPGIYGDNLTIEGGTVEATGGVDAADIAGSESIIISGGSVRAAKVEPAPTSAADDTGAWVFLNTLIVGDPVVAEGKTPSQLTIDGISSSYGLDDVITTEGGMLYLWLTAHGTDDAQVQLTVDGVIYAAYYERLSANTNEATLLPPIVTLGDIPGIIAPRVGEKPTQAIETAQYTGTLTWSPALASDGTFTWDTVYEASISLVAKSGWTLRGVGENFFTVTGAQSVTNAADSNIVTARFPTTASAKEALGTALAEARAIPRGFQSEATWNALQEAIGQGESIYTNPAATSAQAAAALEVLKSALDALRFDYPILDAFVAWSGKGEASVRIDADREKFVRLILASATVDSANYTVTSGSTIITLHEAYLKTLAPGSYDFYAEFSDGSAGPLTLTVKASGGGGGGGTSGGAGSGSVLPATGDSAAAFIALVLALLAAATALLATRSVRLRRLRS